MKRMCNKMGRKLKCMACDHDCANCKTKCKMRSTPFGGNMKKEAEITKQPVPNPKKATKALPDEKEKLTSIEKFQAKAKMLVNNDSPAMSMDTILSLSKKDMLNIFAKQLPNKEEAALLVKLYYQVQKTRLQTGGQIKACDMNEESSYLLTFFNAEYESIEKQIKLVLDAYTDADSIGWTLKQACGIGPVISAGLISGFDVTKSHTAGGFWKYCGLDPTLPKKAAGVKLQYNQSMKVLVVYKLGESFVKVANNKNDIYGKIYQEWKQEYANRNEAGIFAEKAKAELDTKAFKNKDENTTYLAYINGKYPDLRIYNMARRKPLMIFISHMFDLMFQVHYHKKSPVPYAMAYLDHVHMIENPLIGIYESKFGKIPMDEIEQV